MWSQNGDKVSLQYTGTESNITCVIEQGKKGLRGKLQQLKTGVQRFFANNFTDNDKNECIKILTQKHGCQQCFGLQRTVYELMQ